MDLPISGEEFLCRLAPRASPVKKDLLVLRGELVPIVGLFDEMGRAALRITEKRPFLSTGRGGFHDRGVIEFPAVGIEQFFGFAEHILRYDPAGFDSPRDRPDREPEFFDPIDVPSLQPLLPSAERLDSTQGEEDEIGQLEIPVQ